jgi:hypothetical protein
MSFIVPSQGGKYLNAKTVMEMKLMGQIATITGEGEIKEMVSPEGKHKTVWNIPVSMKDVDMIYTPNATNMKIMAEAWGSEKIVNGVKQKGIEQKDVVGKSFKIGLVKVNFRGQMVDSVQIEPIIGQKVAGGQIIETIKVG